MMRLRRLDLDFFGHFTGQSFDFGARREGVPDFHILHGPNEAGKTTTMEGYLRLLYGFKARGEDYAFLHDRKTLKVSGVLEIDGEPRGFSRFSTALTDATGAPVPESAIDRALAGLGQEEYRKLLCLDDETIERGGQEIIDSKGDIGRLLFAASAGIGDLTALLDKGVEEARGLYLKGSGKTRFAALLKEIDGVKAALREADVSASAWRGLRERLAAARADEEEASAARRAVAEHAERLKAQAEALPLLDTIGALRDRLDGYAHYPERLDIDPESLVSMLADRARHEADRDRLTAEIAALRETLDGIARDPEGTYLAEALSALEGLRAEYLAAEKHLPNRRASRDMALKAMRRCADDLSAAPEVDPATLAPTPAALAALEEARTALKAAGDKVDLLRGQSEQSAEDIAEARGALDALADTAPAGAEIAALLDRFDRAGHAVAAERVEKARTRAREALDALCIKGRTFDAPPTVSLTAAEAGEIVARVDRLTRDAEEAVKARDALTAEAARLDARIAALTGQSGILSDAALGEARETRETLWTEHRATLNGESADRFETALREVDAMAARRLEQAEDLGALRTLETERADCEVDLEAAETERARLAEAIAETRAPLDALEAETGLALAPTAGGVLAWLAALETAQREARARDAVERNTADTRVKADALAANLTTLLPDARIDDGLATLLRDAEPLADAARRHVADIEKARERLDTLAKAGARCRKDLEKAETALAGATDGWADLVTDLTGAAVVPETLLASLDPLRDLRDEHRGWADLTDRIEKMETERARFGDEIAALAAAHGVATSDDPLAIHAALADAVERAEVAERSWRDTEQAIAAKTEALEAATRALDGIARDIATLGAGFDPAIPTDTVEALREAVAMAREVIAERRELDETERAIRTRLGVADMDGAAAALAGLDAESIAAERALLETDGALAEERYRTAIEARAEAEAALRAVTGDDGAAQLVERRRTLELEAGEVALDWLELRLGTLLAEEAIRRYRDSHRSGMLAATETAFAELTNCAYTRLVTQPDGASETLLAVDGAGSTKPAAAMSKGTRFQLFLALRAAAYDQMAASGAVLPFFCDDVFETFDEDRTRAACALMRRIGRTGQAIYLTHHRHVVDIARDLCGDAVTIHTIGRP